MYETLVVAQSVELCFSNPGVLRKALPDTNEYRDDDKQGIDKQRRNKKCDFIPFSAEPMHEPTLPTAY